MDQLLQGGVAPEASGPFFGPARTQSTCSGGLLTDTSSSTFEELEEAQSNTRRITLCKQVLLEATSGYSGTHLVDMPLLKRAACRNSGALLPLLSMLSAEQEPGRVVRVLDTLSFLLLDRANRRACHELRALDVLLDILRRASDQQVALSALEALCCLCKHDAKDKMALWQHPNRGALLSMLNMRYGSALVIETLRVCRTLCFATGAAPGRCDSDGRQAGECQQSCCGAPTGRCDEQQQAQAQQGGSHGAHHQLQPHHPQHAPLQLLEPALLTVAAELLHPSTDVPVLLKALKLLHAASVHAACATPAPARSGSGSGPGCCGCWHNAVFRIVPLLTHCPDVEVVGSALAVLVNLSQVDTFLNMCFASGCIPPLLHLLNHKRCAVSQAASCVLSALSEGGLSREKLCQDTALLAMLRVLHANHCVVVTLGVLYMLGRLASYRGQVVRSLRNWGAVALLTRMQATTQDADAAEGCRQLLQLLGAPPVASAQVAAAAAAAAVSRGAGPAAAVAAAAGPVSAGPVRCGSSKVLLHTAYSSITVFSSGAEAGEAPTPAAAVGALCRTISATAAGGAAVCPDSPPSPSTQGSPDAPARPATIAGFARQSIGVAIVGRPQSQMQGGYPTYGGAAGPACGPLGPIAASVAQAAH